MLAMSLTPEQIDRAFYVGVLRSRNARKQGLRHRAGHRTTSEGEALLNDQQGAAGELALSLYLGQPWNGEAEPLRTDLIDVGSCHEVRTLRHPRSSLIVRKADKPGVLWWLVTGDIHKAPTLIIRGFIEDARARRPEWLRDPNGMGEAFFVPQSELSAPWECEVIR